MGTTAFLYHTAFLDHRTGFRHPENSARLSHLLATLQTRKILADFQEIEPREATVEDLALAHDRDYIARIKATAETGGFFREDQDTAGSPGTWKAALLAAGAVLTAIDSVMARQATNAFCAVRPPGHHADRNRAQGFCFFNNVAIGARYLQQRHGLERIAILDWDVHHGNGTQAIFEGDPSVFYASTHQFPLYPMTGRHTEEGSGAGRGYTRNVPLGSGATDTDLIAAFQHEILPLIRRFNPQFILISAGFDGYVDDPLGGTHFTVDGFKRLTEIVAELATHACQSRIVSVLEGGYNVEGLAECVIAHLQALREAAQISA